MLEESVLDLRKILNHIGKFSKYPKLLQALLKKMCVVWSQDDDSRRVLALIILMKAVKKNPDYFSSCSRGMYLVYVKSSKFIYGSNIGKNNFMKNGLLEFYSLDLNEAYKHAFVFIRQLAITVRKAFLRASKEDTRAVYNWQFVCSLRFWSEFVSRNASSSELIQSLVHPLVQVILGTVSLSPGSRWIALRFHCVECLHILAGVTQLRNQFSEEDGSAGAASVSPFGTSLVPSLPLLLDVFRLFDFNKRSSMASSSPMDLRLMLHFSPSQRRETACLDAVCSWLHDFLTEALTLYAGSVAFPEYSIPAVTEMRTFLKTCRVANFTRNFKVLVKKVNEHADFVRKRRSSIKNLTDSQAIAAVEAGLAAATDSPLLAYYAIHRKARVLELTGLAERFKNENTALDSGDHKSDKKAREMMQKKARRMPGHMDDEEESESSDTDSDASYDLDDGRTIKHISRSKKHKGSSDEVEQQDETVAAASSDEDSDFDLEAALNEEVDDASEHSGEDADQLTDFRLEDFEDENEEEAVKTKGTKMSKKRAHSKSSHADPGKPGRKLQPNSTFGDAGDRADSGDSKRGLKVKKPRKKFVGKMKGDSNARKLKGELGMNLKKHARNVDAKSQPNKKQKRTA
ncbi:hypothetical protein AAHC03_019233 [Spirometra sp. Aus1]